MARRDASELHGPEHVRAYRETDGEDGHDWRNGARRCCSPRPAAVPASRAQRPDLRPQRRRLPGRRLQGRLGQPPGWYATSQENPEVEVQVLGDRFRARARNATPDESRAVARDGAHWPAYDDYRADGARDPGRGRHRAHLSTAFDHVTRDAADQPIGISAWTVVPPDGGLVTVSSPSSAATRSARPDSPVPPRLSAPPTPSSATSTVRHPPEAADPDARNASARVLGDVGQRLGHDEVDARLERRRQPLRRRLEHRDRKRHPARKALERRPSPRWVRIAGWMPAARSRSSSMPRRSGRSRRRGARRPAPGPRAGCRARSAAAARG